MRVDLLDPSAYTPPYDRALAGALAQQGADVRLVTSEFPYGDVPALDPRVRLDERFYRGAGGAAGSRRRMLSKLLRHAPAMRAYRRDVQSGSADIVHAQWLTLPQVDRFLLPGGVPFVVTAHDVLPREDRLGLGGAQRAIYRRADHVVVHSEHGRRRLLDEVGLDPGHVSVIHHGAFTALADLEPVLPPELPAHPSGPVALLPGLLRPYKGVDVLLDAWRSFGDDPPGELWICGFPRMRLPPVPPGVRLVPRFLTDSELAGAMRAADLIVLPYREIDQSGILYAALGLGRPMLLSDVGGFSEVAGLGAAELVAPNEPAALATALAGLLKDEQRRNVIASAAREAAAAAYSWEAAAAAHMDLYRRLLAR